MLTYGSVCSGIEAASVAWEPLGWRHVWFAEIEPFPSAVLAHRYPSVPNLGDMTAIADRIERGEIDAPDVLVGGTPCQAFSVAGKRGSLGDERGNLSLAFCRLADAIDRRRRAVGLRPCIVVWENVPGVLSTKDNAFGCILAGLAGEDAPLVAPGGRWTNAGLVCGPERSVCWRTLDAQWFGVAQRRRRVFAVAGAGDFDPGAVLLEWEGMRRDSPPSREAREGSSEDAGGCAAFGGGGQSGSLDVATSLSMKNQRNDWETETLVAHSLRAEGFDAGEDGTGRGTPLVPCIPINGMTINKELRDKQMTGVGEQGDPSFMLRGQGHQHAVAFQQNTRDEVRLMNGDGQIAGALAAEAGMKQQNYVAVPYDLFQITAPLNRQSRKDGDPCHTLARDNAAHAAVVTDAPQVGVDLYNHTETGDVAATLGANSGGTNTAGPKVLAFAQNQLGEVRAGDVAGTLNQNGNATGRNSPLVAFGWQNSQSQGILASEHHTSTLDKSKTPAVASPVMRVRRLMPVECERLQGFPDDWTLITYRCKPAADGPRYKAIGNSMAVPCMAWIGRRIMDRLQ